MSAAHRHYCERCANAHESIDCQPVAQHTPGRLEDALRAAEISHSGMSYGDEKRDAMSEYARGWGDCLKAIKSAVVASDECSHGVKFIYECPQCRARTKADTAEMIAKATGSAA